MNLILIITISLSLSLFLSPLTILYANRFSIVDVANHRSSHVGVTPRGGGIVFVIVFYIGLLLYSLFLSLPVFPIVIIAFCSIVMAFVGWLDDFKDLSASIRFFIQFIVVLISCMFIPKIWYSIPIVIEKTILILSWIWFINLFNFMDGTDGYAAQEAVFICIGIFLFSIVLCNIALILALSVLGFLRVNYPKAKIFMGDIGSIFLGYIIGGLLIYSLYLDRINFIQPIILTSLFLFDATFTLIKRGLQKKKVWRAHREHWYQRLNIAGASHTQIFWIGVVYNILILLIIYLNKINLLPIIPEVCICTILFSAYCTYIKQKEKLTNLTN